MLGVYCQPADNFQYTQAEFVYDQRMRDVYKSNNSAGLKTEAGIIPSKNEEQQQHETTPGRVDNWINTESSGNLMNQAYKISYTEEYILFNLSVLAKKIEKEFDLWIQKGTNNSMMHVAEIRSLIKQFRPYVSQDTNARIVSSLLSLLFDNNSWDEMTEGKLRHVKSIIARFADRQVDKKEVIAFMKDLDSSNLSILSSES